MAQEGPFTEDWDCQKALSIYQYSSSYVNRFPSWYQVAQLRRTACRNQATGFQKSKQLGLQEYEFILKAQTINTSIL
jgi:hypothetical protein